jgi:hypothetical protein
MHDNIGYIACFEGDGFEEAFFGHLDAVTLVGAYQPVRGIIEVRIEFNAIDSWFRRCRFDVCFGLRRF